MAARLLNELSPWWLARSGAPLADALQARGSEPVHLAQIASDAHMQAIGCGALADLGSALPWLYPLRWLQPGPDALHVVWGACAGPYAVVFLEHVAPQACDALDLATCVQKLARAVDARLDPVVYAVFPPYTDQVPHRPPLTQTRDAFFVVDPATADALLTHCPWERSRHEWPVSTWAKLGVDVTVRCISQARYDALRREYMAWHKELVLLNTAAAKAKAAHAREESSDHTAYPWHTIVCLPRRTDETAPQIKARLAALAAPPVDYVDVSSERPVAHVRCATAQAAQSLAEALGAEAYVLRGAEQAAYWQSVPLRVQNAARRRSENVRTLYTRTNP